MTKKVFGLKMVFKQAGCHIGDLFSGILSIVSALQKEGKNKEPILISAPAHRHEIISMFGSANVEASLEENFIDLWVESYDAAPLTPPITPLEGAGPWHTNRNVWDYFSRFDLTSDDMFEDYILEGDVAEDITDKDIIIFSEGSTSELIHYDVFLEFIKNNIPEYNNIYWNEPKKDDPFNYRANHPDVEEKYILNLSVSDLINTIDKKNPIIVGHRSGMLGIIFHILKNTRVYCFYDMRDPIQRQWRFKNNLKDYQNFDKYIEERSQFHEIELNLDEESNE